MKEFSPEKTTDKIEGFELEKELKLAKDNLGKELFLSKFLVNFLIDLGMGRSTAERRMQLWKKQSQLFRIRETQYLTFDANSELVKLTALEAAKDYFGNKLFKPGELVEFLKKDRKMSGKVANAKIAQWKEQNVLSVALSVKSGDSTGKFFSFEQNSILSRNIES